MNKTFVIDTNIPLVDSNCLSKFGKNRVTIPISVFAELDKFKTSFDILGRNARDFCRIVDTISEKEGRSHDLQIGETLVSIDQDTCGITDRDVVDIASKFGSTVVSNDTQVRLIARGRGLKAEEYKVIETKELSELYDGLSYLTVSPELINEAYKNNFIDIGKLNCSEYYPNQQFVLSNRDNESYKFIGILKNGKVERCRFLDAKPSKIQSKNLEQRLAINLLLDDDIKCVTLSGAAGTSKSFLILAASLQLFEERRFDRILIIRSPMPLSKELNQGFVKGDQNAKGMANMGAITSNLENMKEHKSHMTGETLLESYIDQKVIELVDVSRILGSSFTNKIIIIEEAQSYTPSELKCIISRCGENSRVFINSDLKQQSMNKLIPEATGVFKLIDCMKESNLTAHITMKNIYRSEFARDIERYW